MAGVTINYKDNPIASMQSQAGTKVLTTKGKYCEDDIIVNYVPEGGSPPSGTINITSNGTYDVSDKASAIVAVPLNSKCFSTTLNAQQTGEVSLNPNGDSDIAAHYTDNSFVVSIIRNTETSNTGFLCGVSSNNNLRTGQTIYGSWARSTSSGVSWGNMGKTASAASTRTACNITVSAAGVVSVYGSSSVPIPAGEYLVVCSW